MLFGCAWFGCGWFACAGAWYADGGWYPWAAGFVAAWGTALAWRTVGAIGCAGVGRCSVPGNVDSFMTRQTFQPIRAIQATVSVHSSTLNQPLRTRVEWFVDKAPGTADHPSKVTEREQIIAHRSQIGGIRVPKSPRASPYEDRARGWEVA